MPSPFELEYLCCPLSGGKLTWMDAACLQKFRLAVEAADLVNRNGTLVTRAPEAVLVCDEESLAYPVLDGIPLLVPGEAIALGQLSGGC